MPFPRRRGWLRRLCSLSSGASTAQRSVW